MNTSFKFLVIPAFLGAAVAAHAATVTFNDTINMPNGADSTISLTKFDNGTGGIYEGATLNSITVTIRVTISGAEVELDNDGASATTGTAAVSNSVNSFTSSASLATGRGGLEETLGGDAFPAASLPKGWKLELTENQEFNLSGTTGDNTTIFNSQPGNGDYAIWTPGALQANDSSTLDASAFADYQGSGSISFTANSTYNTSASFTGELGRFVGNTPTGQFFTEVTYEFTPVPEPATYAAFAGLAALGMVAFRRRL